MVDAIDLGEPVEVHKKRPHRHSRGEKQGHPPKDDDYNKRGKLSSQHAKQDIEDHFSPIPETTEETPKPKTPVVNPSRLKSKPKKTEVRTQKGSTPTTRTMPEPHRFKSQGGSHAKPWRGN